MAILQTMVSKRMREAMTTRELTQAQLAGIVGCSNVAINKILSGQTVRSRLLPRIASALNVSLEWLQGRCECTGLRERERFDLPTEHVLCEIFANTLETAPKKKVPVHYSAYLAKEVPHALIDWKFAHSINSLRQESSGVENGDIHHSSFESSENHFVSNSRIVKANSNMIAERLAHAMSERNISQRKLSAITGCSQVTISRILSGQISNSRWLVDISATLGIDHEWLTGSKANEHEAEICRMRSLLPNEATLTLRLYNLLLPLPQNSSHSDVANYLAVRAASILTP
jgi:transcriptional regulator with XRE-family HTH domain